MELATQSQSECIGPAARGMHFIARDSKTGAHGARIKFSASAIVVAHFHGFGQALCRIVACTGGCGLFCSWVVVNVPCTPIQSGLNGNDFVIVAKAHERCVVHFGRIHHAVGAEQIERIEVLFDLGKCLIDCRAKLPLNPFASAQPIAMLSAVGAFVLAHQFAGFFGNGAHLLRAITAHVQYRPHMQSTHRSMGIPSAFAAMLLKHLSQGIGVLSQVL